MPQSIPPGLKREHVLRAITDLDAGIDHPFGSPTGYELVHEGKRYAPKAVVGLAYRDLLGRVLLPEEFSGGEAPGQANFVRRIDFAERDALNRQLARLGEEFVVFLEQHRLRVVGRDDLALKVQWVSQTIGDGLGFDVLSFDDQDESEKLIEVKATGLGKFFPFYVTANEVRCSEDMAEKFHLFRVFDFSRTPRVYILTGSLRATI